MNFKELIATKKGTIVKTSEFIEELGWMEYEIIAILDQYNEQGKIAYKTGIGSITIDARKAFFEVK